MLQGGVVLRAMLRLDDHTIGPDGRRTFLGAIQRSTRLRQHLTATAVVDLVFSHDRSPQVEAMFAKVTRRGCRRVINYSESGLFRHEFLARMKNLDWFFLWCPIAR